ncbi:MAG: hypothetical protein GQ564_11880 [Bacteroidales bacterium]|nr:hypothetical protein [Bacteroidales bacterium]
MKSVKILIVVALVAMSVIVAKAQGVSNINETPFFKAKYKKEQVWDVQRSPAYPVAGRDWTLSGLKGSLDASRAKVDWGIDRYVMFVAELDNSNSTNSLTNDVNSTGRKYNVSLKLYESNGKFVKLVSKWGKIHGIGAKGFLYVVEGKYGTFFSVAKVNASTVIKYKPSLATISKLSELTKAMDVTEIKEDPIDSDELKSISEFPFFSKKYTKENVWDVRRSPAYPVAGRDWTISGLKGSLDANRAKVNWGVGRYVMFVVELDNSNSTNSVTNDINRTGRKYNVSLKLYERDGRFVKVVSKWGRIFGIGAKGFLYEVEGKYGTFFSLAKVNASAVIKYKPTLTTISKLSELKGMDVTELKEDPGNSDELKSISEFPFFSKKYTKENVWDVRRSPAYPVAGRDWTISGLKGSLDANRAMVNWGAGRYVMFVAELDNSNSTNSVTNDINRTGRKYNVSLKLYESNGRFVKVVSKWGKIFGIGAKGFLYEVEGKYGTFFSLAKVNASTVIKYKPTLTTISKLSELKAMDVTELKEDPIDSDLLKSISNVPFFSTKYIKENVWDVKRSPAYPVAGRDWTISGLKSSLDASGATIDWGVGRYVMFVVEVDNTNDVSSLNDDINNHGSKFNISLKLFERNGRLVKVVSKRGKIHGIGAKGFMYEVEGRYGTFFSLAKVNAYSVIKYKPTLAAISKLSQLTKFINITEEKEEPKDTDDLKNISSAPFFNYKYTKENVWNVIPSPTIPIVGQDWILWGLKGSLDSAGGTIDWGVDRYVMLVPELDNTKGINSINDDINNKGTKLNISLKLYESNGTFVKLVSKWGEIYGMGAEGFMYKVEGKYQTFFSVAKMRSFKDYNFKPSLAVISKVSEIINCSELTRSLENGTCTFESLDVFVKLYNEEMIGEWREKDYNKERLLSVEFTKDSVIFSYINQYTGKIDYSLGKVEMTCKIRTERDSKRDFPLDFTYKSQKGEISKLTFNIFPLARDRMLFLFSKPKTPISDEINSNNYPQLSNGSPAEIMLNKYFPPKYKVGDRGPAGGWIFYDKGDYSDGWRYLEAAPEDLGKFAMGERMCIPINGATGTALGTGKSNTEAITNILRWDSYLITATTAVNKYKCGGKSGWYIPSIDELDLLKVNLFDKGIGNFRNKESYWSSSFVKERTNRVLARRFEKSNDHHMVKTVISNAYLRPIRAFTESTDW